MSDVTPFFDETCNGTIFMAVQIWRDEDTKLIEHCMGAWEWDQATAVTGPVQPPQYPELEGPVCSVFWAGRHLHIRADHKAVLRAWVRYKGRFGGQYIRLIAN